MYVVNGFFGKLDNSDFKILEHPKFGYVNTHFTIYLRDKETRKIVSKFDEKVEVFKQFKLLRSGYTAVTEPTVTLPYEEVVHGNNLNIFAINISKFDSPDQFVYKYSICKVIQIILSNTTSDYEIINERIWLDDPEGSRYEDDKESKIIKVIFSDSVPYVYDIMSEFRFDYDPSKIDEYNEYIEKFLRKEIEIKRTPFNFPLKNKDVLVKFDKFDNGNDITNSYTTHSGIKIQVIIDYTQKIIGIDIYVPSSYYYDSIITHYIYRKLKDKLIEYGVNLDECGGDERSYIRYNVNVYCYMNESKYLELFREIQEITEQIPFKFYYI